VSRKIAIERKEGFDNFVDWFPFIFGDNIMTDPVRLLNYFTEDIFLYDMKKQGGLNYGDRIKYLYGGMTPSEYMRWLYKTGMLI